MAIENLIIIGFDRRPKKYTTVALDTMGTCWVTGAGPYDQTRKAIAMYGEDVDPVELLVTRAATNPAARVIDFAVLGHEAALKAPCNL